MDIEKAIRGKKVGICGIGKFQEDFEYVFQEIRPLFYIVNEKNNED